ncbi:MAG: hypothetical protein LBC53_10635 [Spirochaetaceae bacterium]|jgi:predicted nucleic acid-binding Zn ribbon protein|nr:hypothetical protein [Spirochaetaceae bacterium]
MEILSVISAAAFVLALLLFLFYRWICGVKRAEQDGFAVKAPKKEKKTPGFAYAPKDGVRGEAHTCPVCAARFELGENVMSKVFPSTGKKDRLLHITGCGFCVSGGRERRCPVCGAEVPLDEYLIARIFERPGKSHVHIQGCVRCLGTGGA